MKKLTVKTTSLITGCDVISNKLLYLVSPMGAMFRFHIEEPRKPKALPITTVMIIIIAFLFVLGWDLLFSQYVRRNKDSSPELQAALESTFVVLILKFLTFYRIFIHGALYFIPISQHGPISSVMAQGNYILSDKEQIKLANTSFYIFLIRAIIWSAGISAVTMGFGQHSTHTHYKYLAIIGFFVNLFMVMTLSSPFVYICYLSSALGRHVANFSAVYIDPLFDETSGSAQIINMESQLEQSSAEVDGMGNRNFMILFVKNVASWPKLVYDNLNSLVKYLMTRGYPKSSEIEDLRKGDYGMRISETARLVNTHQIRDRLRRTLDMVSELRDTVNDINKMSSMIIMGHLIYELILLIMVTTSSIQAKVYKSVDWLFFPTLTCTICMIISVVYTCVCLDETTSQLKLMINKQFDFIIMNLRVRLDEKAVTVDKPEGDTDYEEQQLELSGLGVDTVSPPLSMRQRNSLDVTDREDEIQSETWSQFQYARKLAGTIHFTMGAILPVSRRLVFPTLAHMLSAVFISIEIMSIVDSLEQEATTSDTPIGHSA